MLFCIIRSSMNFDLPQKIISKSPDVRCRYLGSIEIGLMNGGDW